MSKWAEKLVAETRKRLGYEATVKPHPIETAIADAARKATLEDVVEYLNSVARDYDGDGNVALRNTMMYHSLEIIRRLKGD